MSRFNAIDLSKLPAPEVIQTVEFETMLSEMKAEAVLQHPELAPFLELESEPATKILRVCAYFRMLDRLEFNDGARALLLAFSEASNLDHLAAFWGVERLVVQEADDSVTPPIPEILESDTDFRLRVQLSLEAHTTAGPVGSYVFWAISADGRVKDVSVTSPVPGQVLVTVLSHEGNGVAFQDLVDAVDAALNDDAVRPLCDTVTVQSVSTIDFSIEAELILYHGPGEEAVLAAAEAALQEFLEERHRLGHDITRSGITAALYQSGVQDVIIQHPAADIVVTEEEVANCLATDITVGGRNV